jgi:protein-tyrosine phosphatase
MEGRVQTPEAFVDIHCHLLPGLDDGATDWEMAVAMARMAVSDGIHTVVATPHQLGRYWQTSGDTIRQRAVQLQQILEDRKISLTILPGADVRIDERLVDRIQRGEVLTLGDHGRHVLLELPHELYIPLDGLLDQLASAGIGCILSHPERNLGILARPKLLRPLVDGGCLMQLTAGSLMGHFGRRAQELSEQLVVEGLAHFVSSDAHDHQHRRPVLGEAFHRVVTLVGPEGATELFCHNPACIARGEDIHSVHRQAISRSGPARA